MQNIMSSMSFNGSGPDTSMLMRSSCGSALRLATISLKYWNISIIGCMPAVKS